MAIGLKSFSIKLQSNDLIFRPGTQMRGKIKLILDGNLQLKNLELKIIAEGNTFISHE